MTIDAAWLNSFADIITKLGNDEKVPSYACAVISPVGMQNHTYNASPYTLFPVGSISKSYAAALVAILVDKGFLKWNDPILNYNIKFKLSDPALTARLTIADLLRHMNPLPQHTLTELSEFGFTRDELLAKLEFIPVMQQDFSFNYQNVLFAGIAQIIEDVTGISYEQCLQQELFLPLGMNESTANELSYYAYGDRALPYMNNDGEIVQIQTSNYWLAMGPPSCISSSITDLSKWLQFNIKNSTGLLKAIHTPALNANPPYAMGWWVADQNSKVLCHTGGITGFEGVVAIIPTLNLGIAVTANLSNSKFPYLVANEFIRAAIDEPTYNNTAVLKVERPLSKPQVAEQQIIGRYYNPVLEHLEITSEETAGIVKYKLRVAKNGITGLLTPFCLGPKQHNEHPNYAQFRSNPCFKITWQGSMQAAGEIYYDEDRVAVIADESGKVQQLLFLADSIYQNALIAVREVDVMHAVQADKQLKFT